MKVAALAQAEVFRRIADVLHCSGSSASVRDALIAEHIRTIVYASSVEGGVAGVCGPIHTSRLMSDLARNLDVLPQAKSQVKAVDPGSTLSGEESPYKKVLHALGRTGDVAHIGNGYWIATPTRVVSIDEKNGLLVGTTPTSAAKRLFGRIAAEGLARFIDLDGPFSTDEGRHELLQTLGFWLGAGEDIAKWTERALKVISLRCGTPSGINADGLEIYAPDIFRSRGRTGRWLSTKEALSPIDGFRLCRPNSGFRSYDMPYYWCNFVFADGVHTLGRLAQVRNVDTRRLRFGLDALLKTPRTAKLLVARDHGVLEMAYPLPEQESRVLDLGTEIEVPEDGAPKRIRYSAAALDLVREVLGRLSIKVIECEAVR